MHVDTLSDPAQFAQAIRDLARDAHQTLTQSPSAAALRGLTRRIDVLIAVLGNSGGRELRTWLENARREVRAAAVHRAPLSRSLCLCA
jgi:hypothetical protein